MKKEPLFVHERRYIITPAEDRTGSIHPEANFLKTGCALIGRLRPGETIEQFKERMR
jgi:hypothetical protein